MVPGSTLRYGSNFIRLTRSPRASSRQPMEAAARPLPRLDTTPPVTKMYFADTASPLNFGFGWRTGWARSSIAEWRRRGKRDLLQFVAVFSPGDSHLWMTWPGVWPDCDRAG